MVLYRTSCPLRQFATDHTSGRLFWYMGAPRFLERPLYQSNRVIAQQSVANWQRPRGSAQDARAPASESCRPASRFLHF